MTLLGVELLLPSDAPSKPYKMHYCKDENEIDVQVFWIEITIKFIIIVKLPFLLEMTCDAFESPL